MQNFFGWLAHGGAVQLPRASHPVVHPAPPPPVPDAAAQAQPQGQGPPPPPAPAPAPPPAAEGEIQPVAPAAAAEGQGQAVAPAPAPAAAAEVEGANANAPPPGVVMVDLMGAPGTRWGLGTRLAQALLAAAAIGFMASTDDFNEVTAFRLLVTAEALQCLWSLALAAVDVYALLVKRAFRTPRATTIYSIGDWVTGALTFAAASGSAGITVLINDDLMMCSENHCPSFMASTSMAFFTWFAIAPSCLFNLMTAVYRVQRA
ncbi:CASP-like protein 5A3 [Triticum urartu]|uniref:CASP-like protein 5A3 n=1 Tax=Triticum urartu TaxID=4572 RepID=UPI00204363F7|nr:CASP-like protein 5A3 [Triticum urartu]XP_048531566.1 CASP-like protein 5A3 [Triticum urartu]